MLSSRHLMQPLARQLQLSGAARKTFSHISKARLQPLTGTKPSCTALVPRTTTILALTRYATTDSKHPYDHIDTKHEHENAVHKLHVHPERVSADSSVRHVFTEQGVPTEEHEVDVYAAIGSELKTIRSTFSMEEVPKEALAVGLAGVVPYLATSLSTVYLAWDMNYSSINGAGFLLSGQQAELLLHIIEPLQIGYGAVILSFLGAIHWGLEWAKYGGNCGYKRYQYGVLATAVAWPTLLMPIEYALITQFLTFTFLYYADARAAARGFAPHWYGIYRFVLTFIVGTSIVITLIGRGRILAEMGKPTGVVDRVKELRESQWVAMEEEEKARNAVKKASKATEEDDQDEEEEGDEEEE